MKSIFYISAAVFICLMLSSCDTSLSKGDLVGRWTQVSIESRIDSGEPELTNEPALWTFNDDQSYTIEDEEQTEAGLWDMEDSVLTLMVVNEDDTLETCYQIIACENDTLMCTTETQSDYGLISETTTLTKIK